MIIGQLYYYNKKLDEAIQKIDRGEFGGVELLGLENDDLNELEQDASVNEFLYSLREKFNKNYREVLRNEEFVFASDFWDNLTTPVKEVSKDFVEPKSDFQNDLYTWFLEGALFEKIEELLNTGFLTDNSEDYALFYGLKVMYALNRSRDSREEDSAGFDYQADSLSTDNLSENPEMVVVTKSFLAPLFANLNCKTVSPKEQKELIREIKLIENSNKYLKLILLVDNTDDQLESAIRKNISPSILVASVDIDRGEKQDSGFFDDLVKKTLGVRLT
jgi:hypothetical protein